MKFIKYIGYITIEFVVLLIIRVLFGFEIAVLFGFAEIITDVFLIKNQHS